MVSSGRQPRKAPAKGRSPRYSLATMSDQESLLPTRSGVKIHTSDAPVHPWFWTALGGIYVCLGIVQLTVALVWRWWFGVAIGFGITKLGTSLLGLGLTGGRPPSGPPSGSSAFVHMKHAMWLTITSGSSKIAKLMWIFRWPIYGYGLFALLLVLIHVASPNPRVKGFPDACPRDRRFACSRVAFNNYHAARGLQPLQIPATSPDVQNLVEKWINSQSGTRILRSNSGFIHARFLSLILGFADDVFVGLKCDVEGHTIVEVQGQSRIGYSDLGVNHRRNARLLQAVQVLSQALPEDACSPKPRNVSLPPDEKKD